MGSVDREVEGVTHAMRHLWFPVTEPPVSVSMAAGAHVRLPAAGFAHNTAVTPPTTWCTPWARETHRRGAHVCRACGRREVRSQGVEEQLRQQERERENQAGSARI